MKKKNQKKHLKKREIEQDTIDPIYTNIFELEVDPTDTLSQSFSLMRIKDTRKELETPIENNDENKVKESPKKKKKNRFYFCR